MRELRVRALATGTFKMERFRGTALRRDFASTCQNCGRSGRARARGSVVRYILGCIRMPLDSRATARQRRSVRFALQWLLRHHEIHCMTR